MDQIKTFFDVAGAVITSVTGAAALFAGLASILSRRGLERRDAWLAERLERGGMEELTTAMFKIEHQVVLARLAALGFVPAAYAAPLWFALAFMGWTPAYLGHRFAAGKLQVWEGAIVLPMMLIIVAGILHLLCALKEVRTLLVKDVLLTQTGGDDIPGEELIQPFTWPLAMNILIPPLLFLLGVTFAPVIDDSVVSTDKVIAAGITSIAVGIFLGRALVDAWNKLRAPTPLEGTWASASINSH